MLQGFLISMSEEGEESQQEISLKSRAMPDGRMSF
jgi:hypothetical protein